MKTSILSIIFFAFVFLLSGCESRTYELKLFYDTTMGQVQGIEGYTHHKDDVILWDAVPNERVLFSGWYIDGILHTTEPSLLYTVKKSVDIEARFEWPKYTLLIESVSFYAANDNPNSDHMFELKIANFMFSLNEVQDQDIFPVIEWANIAFDEDHWIVVEDEEEVLIHSYTPDKPLVFQHLRNIESVDLTFNYIFGFHIQFSTGQHLSSTGSSGTGYQIRLEAQSLMGRVRIKLMEDSYASIYMDMTYRLYDSSTGIL